MPPELDDPQQGATDSFFSRLAAPMISILGGDQAEAPAETEASAEAPAADAAAPQSALGPATAMLSNPFVDMFLSDEQKAELKAQQNKEAAQAELAGKFQVGEGGGMTEDGKAVLTQAQYDAMLGTYAQIRSGDSHLQISTLGIDDEEKAAKFKADTLANLATIMQTQTGREMISQIANQSGPGAKDVTIGSGQDVVVQKPDGHWEKMGNQARAWNKQAAKDGSGSGSTVFYNDEDETATHDGQTLHSTKDTILFHELTHAFHNMQGTRDPSLARANPKAAYDAPDAKAEEQNTIGIGAAEGSYYSENEYRAQQRALAANLPADQRAAAEENYAKREMWGYVASKPNATVTDTRPYYKWSERDGQDDD